jgi:hypothetical protein
MVHSRIDQLGFLWKPRKIVLIEVSPGHKADSRAHVNKVLGVLGTPKW